MSVDISRIKPGDEVTVRLLIISVNENGVWATHRGWHPSEAINLSDVAPDAIVSHTPKALSVGDRVKPRSDFGSALRGVLLAVDGDEAWVCWGAHAFAPTAERKTWDLSDLERIA